MPEHRVYTGLYQDKSLAERGGIKIGTTVSEPKFPVACHPYEHSRLLAPTRAFRFRDNTDQFIAVYREQLAELGVDAIASWMAERMAAHGVNEITLLCFCKGYVTDGSDGGDNFCHRRMFATWWGEQTGEVVEDLSAMKPPPTLF